MELPIRPADSDCCGNGCNPCIFDIYEQQLKAYYSKCCADKPLGPINNCLSQTSYSVFEVTKIKKDTEDTNHYTFKFVRKCSDPCDKDCRLIIKPGQYMFLRGDKEVKGKLISRPYAVFMNDKDDFSFDMIFKLWPQGQMSDYIENLMIGTEVYWRGPYGDFNINYKWDHVLLIAAGTGIAPLYGVMMDILKNEKCETRLKLITCCKDHKNIHLRYELHELSTFWNFNYEILLGEEKSEDFIQLHREKIQLRLLQLDDIKKFFDSIKDCENNSYQVLTCGSNEFVQIVLKFLEQQGVAKDKIHRF